MKAGLAALTKFVKVVMAYRPDPAKKGKPSRVAVKVPRGKRATKPRQSVP